MVITQPLSYFSKFFARRGGVGARDGELRLRHQLRGERRLDAVRVRVDALRVRLALLRRVRHAPRERADRRVLLSNQRAQLDGVRDRHHVCMLRLVERRDDEHDANREEEERREQAAPRTCFGVVVVVWCCWCWPSSQVWSWCKANSSYARCENSLNIRHHSIDPTMPVPHGLTPFPLH